MAITDNFFKKAADKFSSKTPESIQVVPQTAVEIVEAVEVKQNPRADFTGSMGGGGTYRTLFTHTYNGEKDLGEIGPIKIYKIDYDAVRYRSWQSYLESEICQMVIKRFSTWVIGSGLKLQSQPNKQILQSEGVKLDVQSFSQLTESYFSLYKKSNRADYSKSNDLDDIARTAHINAIVGGDVLVVLRYEEGELTVQLVDGAHIQSPVYGTEWYPQDLPNGNQIINGIEFNAKKQIIAYWVRQVNFSTIRIAAVNEDNGLKMAWMIYGSAYRLDNVRGLPILSTVLESLKKLDRYKEATVGSAEERQKIAYTIEHELGGTGENPIQKQMTKAFDFGMNSDQLPQDINATELANTVAASTNKQTFNMPNGAKLHMLESKNELYFKDFYTINIHLICAAIGIPPNVATSFYDGSYSASRAALKDWEHTLNVDRNKFAKAFYQPIYEFWLDIQILKNVIDAPGYLKARLTNNVNVLESFRSTRYVGAMVPHIDPLKEANAERVKLGDAAAALPMTTLEAATEALNGGESSHNLQQFADELNEANELGIKAPEVQAPGTKPAKEDD